MLAGPDRSTTDLERPRRALVELAGPGDRHRMAGLGPSTTTRTRQTGTSIPVARTGGDKGANPGGASMKLLYLSTAL